MPGIEQVIPLLVYEDIQVVQVDDVDAHHERAAVAGASIESDPRDRPYGPGPGGFRCR